jgi:hypothetical protein
MVGDLLDNLLTTVGQLQNLPVYVPLIACPSVTEHVFFEITVHHPDLMEEVQCSLSRLSIHPFSEVRLCHCFAMKAGTRKKDLTNH